jgi:hypothetical protein
MFYFKLILILCSLFCLVKSIAEENLEIAYEYLIYVIIMMLLVFFIEPVV